MGSAPDFRRLLSSPWILGAAAVLLLVGIFMWQRTRTGAGAAQTAGTASMLQPASTGNAQAADSIGLQVSGLQQELGNLIAQWSAGVAGLGSQPSNGASGSVGASQYSNQVPIGAGYGVPGTGANLVSSSGYTYAQVNQPYASLEAAGLGPNVFWQAAPGTFLPVTYDVARTGAASGAPLYVRH